MTLEAALYGYLIGAGAVSALVGQRVYPVTLPQSPTLPAITYLRVSGVPIRTMGGRQGRSPRIQIDCWATTALSARAVAEAVIGMLDHYSGAMGAGVTVRGSFLENDMDDYDPTTKRYRAILDFVIHHEEITS